MGFKDLNSTERFTDRVEDYVKYRPSYPGELLDFLNTRCLLAKACVADIGAGTGIFTSLLIARGADVLAVEPNAKMRAAAEGLGAKLFPGTAEATGLADHSVDLITCAQAFHWFDPEKTRAEFRRILKPGKLVALVWNDVDQSSEIGRAYERVRVEFGGTLYRDVQANDANLDDAMTTLFGGEYEAHVFHYTQELTREALRGRYFSSSYSPKAESPERAAADTAVSNIFDKFQQNGCVFLDYRTELFLGPLL